MVGMNQIDSPLRMLFRSFGAASAQMASDALIEGLILGYNPRKVAPMVRDALGIQLNRALTICRTEVLRAHREAAHQIYAENTDVVKGWRWQAALSGNTCAVCISLHGREFPMSEKMSSHPNCRCCAAPITYSWEELGERLGVDWSGVDDAGPSFEEIAKKYKMTPYPVRFTAGTSAPAELLQIARYRARTGTGVDYFKSLTPEEQRKILGNAKWLAWKEGKFAFDDIWKSTWSDEWGAGKAAASLNELVGEDEAKRYFTLASLKKSVGWADAGEDQTFIAGKLSEFVREKIGDIVSSDTINMTNSVREHVQKHSNEFDVERAFTMLAGIIDNPLYIMQGKKSNSLQFVDDFDDKFFVLVPIKHLPEEMWVETIFIEEKNRFLRRWGKRTVYYERK